MSSLVIVRELVKKVMEADVDDEKHRKRKPKFEKGKPQKHGNLEIIRMRMTMILLILTFFLEITIGEPDIRLGATTGCDVLGPIKTWRICRLDRRWPKCCS